MFKCMLLKNLSLLIDLADLKPAQKYYNKHPIRLI